MKTQFLALLLMSAASQASELGTLISDDKIVATLNIYGNLENFLTCVPGRTAGPVFQPATPDKLRLHAAALNIGLSVRGYYEAESRLGMNMEPLLEFVPGGRTKVSEERPYDRGCGPAIEQFKKALIGLDRVDIEVTRNLSVFTVTRGKTESKLNGEFISAKVVQHELNAELIYFDFAGFKFKNYQQNNGRLVSGF